MLGESVKWSNVLRPSGPPPVLQQDLALFCLGVVT